MWVLRPASFSFNRLQKADPVLGVDMASTGEVGCIGTDTSCRIEGDAVCGYRIPERALLSQVMPKQKADTLEAARMLQKKGYKLYATGGSSHFLTEKGGKYPRVLAQWGRETSGTGYVAPERDRHGSQYPGRTWQPGELDNGYKIRRAAIDLNVPLITNARLASAFINAFCTMTVDDIAIKSWSEY